MKDFSISFNINCPRIKVFRTISKDLGKWWGNQDKPIEETGNIFKVAWGEPWYQFKVTQYSHGDSMTWECIDANQKIDGLAGVEKEWVGTKIHWKLVEINNSKTRLDFLHEGLTAEFLCFDFCSKTWDHFLNDSLVRYLQGLS